jgi:hypothetical protein
MSVAVLSEKPIASAITVWVVPLSPGWDLFLYMKQAAPVVEPYDQSEGKQKWHGRRAIKKREPKHIKRQDHAHTAANKKVKVSQTTFCARNMMHESKQNKTRFVTISHQR